MNIFHWLRSGKKQKQPSALLLKVETIDGKVDALIEQLAQIRTTPGPGVTPETSSTTPADTTEFAPFEPFETPEEMGA